jgi:DNA-binding transcriptional LysR family regulator
MVSPADVGRYPFVTGLRGSRYFDLVRAALKTSGIERFEVAMELQESAAVKEMVRHGAGIACLPRCTVTAELAAGTLVALNLTVPPQDLELRCGYRVPLAGAARRFVLAMKGGK